MRTQSGLRADMANTRRDSVGNEAVVDENVHAQRRGAKPRILVATTVWDSGG